MKRSHAESSRLITPAGGCLHSGQPNTGTGSGLRGPLLPELLGECERLERLRANHLRMHLA